MSEMENNKKLKGAIVGFGFISSKGHMPAYADRIEKYGDVEIIAICDICPDRESDVPAGIRFYTDYQDLFSKELENLDFVDVSTHAADHYKIAKMGLEKGLHVLCEKPLTTSLAEAEDLIQTAIYCERVLFPCHNYKYAPVVNAIRDVVESGKIGKPHHYLNRAKIHSGLKEMSGKAVPQRMNSTTFFNSCSSASDSPGL